MIKKIKIIWTFLQKHFDKALYRGGWMQFFWLTVFVAFWGALGVWASSRFDVDGWRVIELLLDPGSFCDSDEEACGKANIYFQLIVTLLGAVFFTSFLIGSVGNFLERRIDRYRNGGVAYEVDDHILIIGAGSMLVNLIKSLLEDEANTKRDIVILTSKDAEEVRAHVFSEIPKKYTRNIYVYYGSRMRKDTLNKLDAFQTKAIYLLGEDDEPAHDSINMKCYEVLSEVCKRSQHTIECYMVLERLTSLQLFYYRQDNASSGNLRLTVVNSLENVAQRVLVSQSYRDGETYPTLDRNGILADDEKFVHFIIVGMSPMGYAMAITAAHVCHFPNFHSKGLRTKITFVQAGIKQEMNFFLGRYSELMKLSYWEYVNLEDPSQCSASYPDAQYVSSSPDRKGFLDIEWEFIDGGIEAPEVRDYLEKCAENNDKSELLTIALCGDSPEENASAALFLPEIINERQIPLFVYQPGGDQMMRIVKDSPRYSHIYPFGMKTDAFDKQCHERMKQARRIMYLYSQEGIITDMPEGDEKELVESWFNTQYAFQQSNMYAANSIPFKLRSLSVQENKELSEEDIDLMARTEHNRWNIERLLMGFSPYPFSERMSFKEILSSDDLDAAQELDTKLKAAKKKLFKHKDIAPYDELLDDSKKYDRTIVKNIFNVSRI